MDIIREFNTGALRLRVLRHAVDSPVNGAWLTAELAGAGHRVSPGTLYPLLHRMQEAGLLKSATEVVDGRRVRRYRATKRGKRALAAARTAAAALAADLAGDE